MREVRLKTLVENSSRLSTGIYLVVASGALTLSALTMARLSRPTLAEALTAISVTIIAAGTRGVFRIRMVPDLVGQLPTIGGAALWGTAAGMLVGWASGRSFGVENAGMLFVSLAFGLLLGLILGTVLLRKLWRGGYLRSRTLLVGDDDLCREIKTELEHRPDYGVDVVDHVRTNTNLDPSVDDLSSRLADSLSVNQPDRIIFGPIDGDSGNTVRAVRLAGQRGLAVYVVPRLFEVGLGLDSISPDRVRGYPLVRVQRSAHPRLGLIVKRGMDLLISMAGLLVLSPLLLLIAIGVRLSSPGPILFRQTRIGQNGEEFTVYKFRSMYVNDGSDSDWTAPDKTTPIGAVLRRSAFDEVPQLFSVVSGKMSLVGPRPERPTFVTQFSQQFPDYNDRHRMPVGLTGLAQVAGLVGDTPISERIKYDNIYIDQWSLSSDIQIMLRTVWALANQSRFKREHSELQSAIEASATSPETEIGNLSPVRLKNLNRPDLVIDIEELELAQNFPGS